MKASNTIHVPALCLIVVIFLYSCKNTRQGVREDFQQTREQVKDALTKSDEEIIAEKKGLYAKMEGKKKEINIHIDQLEEDAGDQINNVINQLKGEKEKLDRQLNLMESAPNETWNRTKSHMESVLKEVTQTVDNVMAGLQQ